ncbi:MAG: TadE/TadG family type IV pilus assembly protein [Pseudomonadota bacterium]
MHLPFRRRRRERGVAAVEFAMLALFFFAFVGGIVETARLIYVINTMGEVARHGARMAATAEYCSPTAMSALRSAAVFGGRIPATDNITDANVVLAYLQADASTPVAARPPTPALNLSVCTANPASPNCIRYVRVRLCESGSDCNRIEYKFWLPVSALLPPGGLRLPDFSTVVPAESLGYRADAPGSCI